MEIPHSPQDLTPVWLTTALRNKRELHRVVVRGFGHSPLEPSQGLYGQLVRLRLEYDPAATEGPRTIVAKFSSSNPQMRQRPDTIASYEREVRFYQEVAGESPVPVPTCYYADVDTESGWHILLLEDLAPARSGSAAVGCSQSEARTAILHIARLHAYWWGSPKLDKFDWLAASPRIPNEHELQYFREHMWPVFLEKMDKPLPDEMMAIGTFLGKNLDRIERHLFEKSQTLVHSDYHPGNLMFGTGQNRPFSIVDWQFVKRGRGIWDVGYFMLQSLNLDDRRAAEMDLVRYYLEVLNDFGVQGYAFENAMLDYRISLLRRFGNLITTIAAMPFAKAQVQMHIEVLLPRAVSAILDNDCRSLLSRVW